MSVTSHGCVCQVLRQHVRGDLFTASIFEEDVSRHAVKVTGRISDVALLKLRQSLYHSIDRLIRIVFRVTKTFGDEDAYQPGANYLVSCSCFFAIGVEPLKQSIKWFLGDGHLSASSLELGIDKDVCREVRRLDETCLKLAQTLGNSKKAILTFNSAVAVIKSHTTS